MTKFKICGLREMEHVRAATDASADFLGFVFVPGVRREVSPEQATELILDLRRSERGGRKGHPLLVGLFANQPIEEVNGIIRCCGLDAAQLCGDEPPAYWHDVEAKVIKQIKVREEGTEAEAIETVIERVEEVLDAGHLALLDKSEVGSLGGTGRTFDWRIAGAAARHFKIILAGGLTPQNVGEAIATVAPWGVDVSSGVETNGIKDPAKIAAFADAVRAGRSAG